jgi:amino acid permease
MHLVFTIMMLLISIVGYFVANHNRTTTFFWLVAIVGNTCTIALMLIMPILPLHL